MLKRFLVLAFAMVLFVTAFFIYFHISDARIEGQFRAEREKFHVDNQDLVSSVQPGAEPLTPTPPPLPVVSTPSADNAVPTPNPATPAPAGTNSPAEVPLDSNTLIGPLPPSSNAPSNAPMDSNTPGGAPVPATPATNSSPDSTLIYPGLRRLPLFLLASYNHGPRIQTTGAAPTAPATPAPPTSTAPADTNGEAAAPATTSAAASKAAPANTEPIVEGKPAKAPPGSVIVLGYHQFNPPGVRGTGARYVYNMPQDVFDGEMKYLKDNHFNVVPLSDVVAFAKRQVALPPNTVAITIDDGYKSSIVYAAPVLKKYGFPWTFFVYPAFITTHESKGAASWDDLVELEKEGVDVECHSMTHPFLTKRRGKTPEQYDAWLTTETDGAKAIIEQHLNKTVKYFAYPFGDYNKEVEAKTIGAGFEAIFTVAGNPIHPGTNPYAMGRYVITAPVEKAFVSYLHEGALGLADITPAPGATVTDPRPVISAVLGYAGTINPTSIVAEVSNMGEVRHDFDPKTLILRLYLPRDLIEQAVKINVYAKDADTGKTMVASWHFNYQATAPGVAHAPIAATATNAATSATETNAPATEPAKLTSAPATNTTETAPPATVSNTATETTSPSNAAPAAASNAAPAADSNATPAAQ